MPGGIFQGVLAGAQEERMRRLDSIRLASQQSQMMHQRAVEALMNEKLLELAGHHSAQDENAATRTTDTVHHHAAEEGNAAGKLELGGGTLDLGKGKLAETVRHDKAMEARPVAKGGGGAKGLAAIEDLGVLLDNAKQLRARMDQYKNSFGPGASSKLKMQGKLEGISLPIVGNVGAPFFSPGTSMGPPKGWANLHADLQNLLVGRMHRMGGARAVATEGARKMFEGYHPDIDIGYGQNAERLDELITNVGNELKYRQRAGGMSIPLVAGSSPPAASRPGVYSSDEAF